MNTLSLCVICKNEEHNIKNLLESIKGDLFDEIVICDTGSSDNTVQIARAYPKVKLEIFTWIQDFSAARNYSFSKATSSHIMWLDADDIILEKDYKKLLELKKQLHEVDMWMFKYEYAHDSAGNSICSFYRERIVNRSLNIKWQEPIHEYLPLTGSFQKRDIEIHHYKKHNSSARNITILEDSVKKNPNNARNVYYLGKEYLDNSQNDEGYNTLLKFVDLPDAWTENKYTAFIKMHQYCLEKQDYKKAKEYLHKAVQENPTKAEAYFKLGDLNFFFIKNNNEAKHWYDICTHLKRPEDALDIIEPKYYTWAPHLQLALVYNSMGDLYNAAISNEKALKHLPTSSTIQSNKKIFMNSLKEKYPNELEISFNGMKDFILKKEEKPLVKKEVEEIISFDKKVGWLVPNYISAGTIRIRTLNINNKLKEKGYKSDICDYNSAFNFDVIVVGKSFSERDLSIVRELKKSNRKVICDLSEDILDFLYVKEILAESHLVICCSETLKNKVIEVNKNTILIEDAVEVLC